MRKNLKYISVLLSAALAASAMSLGGFAVSDSESGSISVRYAEANTTARLRSEVSTSYLGAAWESGEVAYTEKTTDCTAVESSTEAVTWYNGWYVVSGEVTISEPVTVNGEVNLILADGCTLNAEKGIVVTTGNSLTIYAQSGGTGTLNATGVFFYDKTTHVVNASAGIGGSGTAPDSGAITIHGGVINATGGGQSGYYGAAGIGGGSPNSGNGGNSGAIIIYGGTITANSGAGNLTGAGIGGGAGGIGNGGAGSNIVIYGGNVTASSTGTDTGGAGIGGGSGVDNGGVVNNIQIYGGTVNATGGNLGAGIGGGGCGSSADSSHKAGNGTGITISGGKVTAVGGKYAAGIGGGGGYYYSISYSGVSISGGCIGGTGSVTISGGIVNAGSPTDVYYSDYKGDPIGNGGNAGDTAATVTISEGYAVYQNGTPVEKGTEVTGAVTVKQCGHEEIEVQDNGDGTHGMSCPYCGYSYSHDTTLTATTDNNVIMVREACDTCGYDEDLGTVTIHIPEIVYGDLTGVISAETTLTETVVVAVIVDNNPSGSTTIFPFDPPTMATLTGNVLLSAGTHQIKIEIIIDRDEMYVAECDLPFTIDKATLTADGAGTANGTYGTALSELQITGITAKLNDTEIAGKWEFVDTTLPNSGTSVRKAVFVPTTGADNFKELSADITLNISKAQGVLNLTDTTLNKKFGTDSKFSLESYCTTASDGVISYTTDSAAVTVSKSGEVTIIGAGEAVITVSLAEGTNYTAAENKTITINVEKADNPPNKPSSVMNVSQRIENLKDVPLPENWQWQDADTALEVGVEVTATAEYIGADKGNYKNLTAVVEVTRSDCNHDNTELRDVVTATCQQKGYTGDTYCTDCGERLLYGNETPLADHISDNGTVTKQPTTSETGERTYKCTVCGCVIRTETIAKLQSGGGSGGSTRPSEPTEPETPSLPNNEVPFIKDKNGKNGWEVINEEIYKAENGSTVTVDMNGAAVVPGNVFGTLKGRDVTVVFDMGEGITWSVNGKDVISDKTPNINFSVKTDTENIPVDVINNITGERYSIQISLAHNGEFGFTAVLSINLGSGNAGQKAALYYYNGGALELMCESEISADGTARLTFTHASDYLIVIDEIETDDNNSGNTSSGESNPSEDDNSGTTSGSEVSNPGGETGDNDANPSTGAAVSLIPLATALAFVTATAKRKKK